MAPVAPGTLVRAEPRKPLKYALDSVVDWRTGERWESGITWMAIGCSPALGRGGPECDPDDITGIPKDFTGGAPVYGDANPFAVYGTFLCTPVGITLAEAQQAAIDHLEAREVQRVEQAFWTGDLDNQPNLQNYDGTTAVILGGAAQPIDLGIGYLEYEIATRYGSEGVIHMTRGMALMALGADVLKVEGGELFTQLGTPVVAGTGYSGEGPAGQPATAYAQSWAFATPTMFGYRSEVLTSSAQPGDLLDRTNNDLYAIAERSYLLAFDPCGISAVLLDRTLSGGSGGGGTGPQGPAGESAYDIAVDNGFVGTEAEWLASLEGADGADGEPGPEGPQGAVGPAGADGEDGAEGPQGPAGADGDPGPKGDTGDTGPAGEQGPKGDKGDPGDPGVDGVDGTMWFTGAGAPTEPVAGAAEGDLYLDTVSGDVYELEGAA